MRYQRLSHVGLSVLLIAGLMGCGSGAPRTVKVKGKVNFNGRPLRQGTVSFVPQAAGDGDKNRPATGVIDEEGNYTLSTFAPNDGALPGKYIVAVVSNVNEPSVEEMAEGAKIDSLIPKGYNIPAHSGLTATVPDSDVTLDFELKTGGAPDDVPTQKAGPAVDQFGT